jgi:hypothetical protein
LLVELGIFDTDLFESEEKEDVVDDDVDDE